MRIVTALIAAGLLFVAVTGCHEKKQANMPNNATTADGGAAPAQPAYPPAQ